jgi:hypothetical protein
VTANQGEEGIVALCEHLLGRGVGIEAGLLERADAEAFVRSGLVERRARVLVEPLDETTLVAPRIVAGRGEVADFTRVPGPEADTPTVVRIPSLGIGARVVQVVIDVRHGVLGLPSDVQRAGWWRDGAALGGRAGATLIAGHVDSVHAGTGAFFNLRLAHTGARVQVATEGGSSYSYRVVSVRTYLKSALPTSVYSRTGAPRLVLVTCGGPFDPVSRHYRDNVVLTAVPA